MINCSVIEACTIMQISQRNYTIIGGIFSDAGNICKRTGKHRKVAYIVETVVQIDYFHISKEKGSIYFSLKIFIFSYQFYFSIRCFYKSQVYTS